MSNMLIVIIVLFIALCVSSGIGAMLIRAAIALFNKLSGDPRLVPEPEFGKAFGIAFASSFVSGAVGFVIGMIIGAQALANKTEPNTLLGQLISLPLGFLVMAGMLAAMLPTTFTRGMLITLLYAAIAAVIYGFFFAILYMTGMITP